MLIGRGGLVRYSYSYSILFSINAKHCTSKFFIKQKITLAFKLHTNTIDSLNFLIDRKILELKYGSQHHNDRLAYL